MEENDDTDLENRPLLLKNMGFRVNPPHPSCRNAPRESQKFNNTLTYFCKSMAEWALSLVVFLSHVLVHLTINLSS